jgi:L-serine dehydratase
MQSIKLIYKIGRGPSSSHTMGPHTAAELFRIQYPCASSYRVTLYGSLALTGKGHLTDVAVIKVFSPKACEIIWDDNFLSFHPNALKLEAIGDNSNVLGSEIVYSVGGGDIVFEKDILKKNINNIGDIKEDIYSMNELNTIENWAYNTGKSYWEYVEDTEDKDIWDYLNEVWKTMKAAVERGVETEGVIPGGLAVQRKACSYFTKGKGYVSALQNRAMVFAYSLAVSEENACGGMIVTAPTCGSCGVLPGVLYHLQKRQNFSDIRILRALATAGLIGNIIKENASISGAEAGCQAEIGTACSMASAAATQLFGGSPSQIEYSAEMGMEHHLGMTCDPVGGFVQIPCIERCAFAAARALNCNMYAMLSDGRHRIPFDKVVATMLQTGKDLPSLYRETSKGGLAVQY